MGFAVKVRCTPVYGVVSNFVYCTRAILPWSMVGRLFSLYAFPKRVNKLYFHPNTSFGLLHTVRIIAIVDHCSFF